MTGRQYDLVVAFYPHARGFAYVVFDGPLSPVDWGMSDLPAKVKARRCLRRLSLLLDQYQPDALLIRGVSRRASKATDRDTAGGYRGRGERSRAVHCRCLAQTNTGGIRVSWIADQARDRGSDRKAYPDVRIVRPADQEDLERGGSANGAVRCGSACAGLLQEPEGHAGRADLTGWSQSSARSEFFQFRCSVRICHFRTLCRCHCSADTFQARLCLLCRSAAFQYPCDPPVVRAGRYLKLLGHGKYLTCLALEEAKNTQGSGWTRSPVPFDRGVSITLRVVAQRSRLLLHPRTRRLCKLQAVPAWGMSRRLRAARCVRSSRVCHRRISTLSSRPVFSLVASTCSVKSSVDAARGPTRECVQGQLAGKGKHTMQIRDDST